MVFERENHFEFVGRRVGRRPWQQTWVLPRLPGWINWTYVCGTRFGEEGDSSYLPTYSTNSKSGLPQLFAVTVANRGERVVSIREQLKEGELSF